MSAVCHQQCSGQLQWRFVSPGIAATEERWPLVTYRGQQQLSKYKLKAFYIGAFEPVETVLSYRIEWKFVCLHWNILLIRGHNVEKWMKIVVAVTHVEFDINPCTIAKIYRHETPMGKYQINIAIVINRRTLHFFVSSGEWLLSFCELRSNNLTKVSVVEYNFNEPWF